MKQTKLGPVVATLNLKGGVGKTTVSAHVFRVVWETFHTPTLLIDFDPQFNLTQTLFRRADYEKAQKAETNHHGRNGAVAAIEEPLQRQYVRLTNP